MKSFTATVFASLAASAMAFAPSATNQVTTSLSAEKGMPDRKWNTMVDKTQRSQSLPFLPRPANLDGSMAGDVGFDPFYLSSIPKNFAGFLQPPSWEETDGISTLYWMREAELKHGRVTMLAVVGWIAADQGLRLPFDQYSVENIPSSYLAHNALVEQGSMAVLLLTVGFIEFCSGAVLVQVSKGESDRDPGDFKFDGGKFQSKSDEFKLDMQTKEVVNGRLAMLAFSGIATATALGATEFPYISL